MKIEKIEHTDVLPDGTFKTHAGAVVVDGILRMSTGEGCGLDKCTCSSGRWLLVTLPRTSDGRVEGIRVTFDSCAEMETFFEKHVLSGRPKRN